MKRILKCLFIVLLIIPILVNASSFGDAKQIVNNYQSKFLSPDRYLVSRTDTWGLDGNIRPIKINGFSTGGLITQKEMEITRKKNTNPMSFSYIYDGTKIWTIENKIVSENFISGSDAKTKPTEYVKHDTTVSGIGTKEDPWIFLDSYKVTVKVRSHGKLQVGADTPAESKMQEVRANVPVSFTIKPDSGWAYANHTCGSSAKVENNILTFSSVEKDITCEVVLSESRDSVTLPTPCFSVTTKFGTNSRCFSDPVNNQFFYRYGLGYYNDRNLTVRVGKFTSIPARTGWTFDGYFVGTTEFVSPSGVYETTYTLIDETHKDIVAKGHANEYTITFDPDAPSGELNGAGTPSATVLYEHDLPSIVRPKRKGYIFEGYFTEKNGAGTQYYNADGSEAKIWEEPAHTTLYAKWKICTKDYFCPGDNVEHPCPSGLSTETTGSISCKQCRYYDSCLYNTLECHYGCDCYDYSYQCCSQYYYNSQFRGCLVYGTCSDTYCDNCSSCKYTTGSCTGGYVYNNSCVDGVTYDVNFNKQGGTGGSNGYSVTYYGDSPSIASTAIETPTRAGYVFAGYYTAVNGGGTKIINAKTTTEGFIAESDIRSILPSATPPYTLYAYWIECEAGNYCPGDNTTKPCEPGKYQNQKHQTSCISCIKESNQGMYGATSCEACNAGLTNTVDGKSVCDIECSNKANVKEWEIAVWNNDNTVTNNCKIKSCNNGYSLVNNQCVQNKATIKFVLNSGETIKTPTSNSNGTYNWTIDSNKYIYKNGTILTIVRNYNETLTTDGLPNYNNSGYIQITKIGYTAVSGAEWANKNDSSKKYNQNTQYNINDFCSAKTSDCEVALQVNWQKNSYTVAYARDGGTAGSSAPTAWKFDEAQQISAPTKKVKVTFSAGSTGATIGYSGAAANNSEHSYTFKGWTSSESAGLASTAKTGTGTNPSSAWTGTATTNQYFKNLRTGSGTVTLTATWQAPSIKLPTVTKTGYTCVWTGGASNQASGSTYTPAASGGPTQTNFTASCTPNVIAITLAKDGGSGGTDTIYEKYNTGWYLNSGATTSITGITNPTKSDYTFAGYFNGSTRVIDKGGTIKSGNTSFTSATSVTAKWCRSCTSSTACTLSISDDASCTYTTSCSAGYTLSNSGQYNASCTACSNSTNVATWGDGCTINSCNSGYTISNNKCVPSTITVGSSNEIQTGSCGPDETGRTKCWRILWAQITSIVCTANSNGTTTCRFNTHVRKSGGYNAWENFMYIKIYNSSGNVVTSRDECSIKPYTNDSKTNNVPGPWDDYCNITFNTPAAGTRYTYAAIVDNHGCIKGDNHYANFGWDNCNEMTGTIQF